MSEKVLPRHLIVPSEASMVVIRIPVLCAGATLGISMCASEVPSPSYREEKPKHKQAGCLSSVREGI